MISVFFRNSLVLTVVAMGCGGLIAEDATRDELSQRAEAALKRGDQQQAIAAADAMVGQFPDDQPMWRVAGDVYLRSGQVPQATKWFNQYAKAQPDELPELWQRGIALYFNGDLDEAARQFEVHRTVNPNDVENAAWHFLCVAKSKSVEEAQRLVLPAPGDPRIPMAEVLQMLSTGDTESVIKKMESQPAGTLRGARANFYGDFYLGLYADAVGDHEEALRYLKRCAKDAPRHYMGDVARVYANVLANKP